MLVRQLSVDALTGLFWFLLFVPRVGSQAQSEDPGPVGNLKARAPGAESFKNNKQASCYSYSCY